MSSYKLIFVIAIALVAFVSSSCAIPLWGQSAHTVSSILAQGYLTNNTFEQVKQLIPTENGQLSQVSEWADQIRTNTDWAWTGPLHFINTADNECGFTPSSDCPDNFCLSGAIANYTEQLADSSTSETDQVHALKFLVHFIEDIHQPLHVGFTSDKGGNYIQGRYFNNYNDLHSIWDTDIVYTRINEMGSLTKYLRYLQTQMAGDWANDLQTWATCNDSSSASCPDEWATETAKVACQYAYVDSDGNAIENGFNLGQDYYDGVKDQIDLQLAKAAIRLATTFNNIWS